MNSVKKEWEELFKNIGFKEELKEYIKKYYGGAINPFPLTTKGSQPSVGSKKALPSKAASFQVKCECGGEKSNTTHSDWCPKHES